MKIYYGYGRSLHVFEDEEGEESKKSIISEFDRMLKKKQRRQTSRILDDIQSLSKILRDGVKYTSKLIKDVGHKHKCYKHKVWSPSMQRYKLRRSIWSSTKIWW